MSSNAVTDSLKQNRIRIPSSLGSLAKSAAPPSAAASASAPASSSSSSSSSSAPNLPGGSRSLALLANGTKRTREEPPAPAPAAAASAELSELFGDDVNDANDANPDSNTTESYTRLEIVDHEAPHVVEVPVSMPPPPSKRHQRSPSLIEGGVDVVDHSLALIKNHIEVNRMLDPDYKIRAKADQDMDDILRVVASHQSLGEVIKELGYERTQRWLSWSAGKFAQGEHAHLFQLL